MLANLDGGATSNVGPPLPLIHERYRQERMRREAVEWQQTILAGLGRSLSTVTRPDEAARVIMQSADEMFGLHCFTLDLYESSLDVMRPVLNVDTINGHRTEVRSNGKTNKP